MNNQLKYIGLALLLTPVLPSCKNEDDEPIPPPPPVNEEELITTVTLHFHSANDVEHKHFEFTDLDGDGGNAPVIHADTLSADSVYSVTVVIMDESTNPPVDLTTEIESEGDVHQFFYQASGASVTVAYSDTDVNGKPIGLATTWTVGGAGVGTMMVTLRHEPDKDAAGVSNGDITNAGGETDIEVNFPLVVE
jgi:hypothetical protein